MQALFLPDAICNFSLKLGNVVFIVQQLLFENSFFLRCLLLEDCECLIALFFMLLCQEGDFCKRKLLDLQLLSEFLPSLL